MDNLNPAQLEAVTHINGPMMVIAGPGSGKTFVITRRLKYMIEQGIRPDEILVITFTKASAMEMQERFEKLMDNAYYPVAFGTFHAIYFHIIKQAYGYDYSNILTEKEKYMFIRSILSCYNNLELPENIAEILLSQISKIKNDGSSPTMASNDYMDNKTFVDIYNEYANLLKDNNKLDFEDMVLQCKELLENNPSMLSKVRDAYKYILIDEFQDINPMQYEVIKLIAMPANNLFIVGDDDQSIYGFRGSEPGIMLAFPNEYKNARKVILNTNYRSTPEIVNNAVSLIERNQNRFSKNLKAFKKSSMPIQPKGFDNTKDEMDYILSLIKTTKRSGKYSDIAIIYRTNQATCNITKLLSDNKIPFEFREKPANPFLHTVAKDILAILAFAYGDRSRNHFLRFMNKPVRYIPRSLVEKTNINLPELLKEPNLKPYLIKNIKKLIYDLERIKMLDIYSSINYIRRGMGYEDFILKDAKDKGKDENEIKEILSIVQDAGKSVKSYDEYLKVIDEYENNLGKAETRSDEDRVTIITMHSSKGLEYNTVILPSLNEGVIPSPRSKKAEEIEEERRVFYVAMTRAKERLYLTYINKNRYNRLPKSRFINEIKDVRES